MQVVSGVLNKQRVYFEAPPSRQVPSEMKGFSWFNQSGAKGKLLPPLLRAGVAHFYPSV